jgi:hypothetical protein
MMLDSYVVVTSLGMSALATSLAGGGQVRERKRVQFIISDQDPLVKAAKRGDATTVYPPFD